MMTRVHQYLSLRTCGSGQMQGHSPIGNVSVINGRLKGFVLHEQPLLWGKSRMSLLQHFFEPCFALSNIGGSWIARAIGEPHRYVATIQALCNLNAVFRVLKCARSYGRVWIPKRAVLIFLILEQVWINRSRLHAKPLREFLDVSDAPDSVREVPEHVQCNRRTHARN